MAVYHKSKHQPAPQWRECKPLKSETSRFISFVICTVLVLSMFSTAQADEPELGETRFFWAYAQGFFTGYYPLSATCQQIGDLAYLFTEDARINDILASTEAGSETIWIAGVGGVFKSEDGGLTWVPNSPGLPDADGGFDSFDEDNYNRRADMYSIFSRAEYGESFDTLWVATEFGPFWSTAAGDTFKLRASSLSVDDDTGDKAATYNILGHPDENETLWAATIDGVWMTRNANRWKSLSHGLPPGEGSIWDAIPSFALAYHDDYLFVTTDKGGFYGMPRPLGSSATSNVVTSWLPFGGDVPYSLDSTHFSVAGPDTGWGANTDTLFLLVEGMTAGEYEVMSGQNVTFVDTVNWFYWAGFVDEKPVGLTTFLTEDNLFYYPDEEPDIDYIHYVTPEFELDLDNIIAFGYNPITGQALYVETAEGNLNIWIGSHEGGLYSAQHEGGIPAIYDIEEVETDESHLDYFILDIKKKDDTYYFATDQGLFSAMDPHGDWTQLTGNVYNSIGTNSQPVYTMRVTFGPGDAIYTGGYMGGFLRSEDGLTFDHSNIGMMTRNGTLEQLDTFLEEFENTTPANPDMGVYETMVEWWGALPPAGDPADIDGDSKITFLFLDIDDQYYLDTGDGTFISGFYNPNNEVPLSSYGFSNLMEMIYLDTDPQWIDQAGAAACNQMFHMINNNLDFQEDKWLREGLAAFSQYVAGYPLAEETIQLAQLNTMTVWGDWDSDTERIYLFLLMLYMYEQPNLFPDIINGSDVEHTIAEIAQSEYRGAAGLGRLIHEKWYGTSSDTVDYTSVFASVFNDFILAGALDISNPAFNNGKHGFSAVNTTIVPITFSWYQDAGSTPPLIFHLPFWSTRSILVNDQGFFQTGPNNENIINDVITNGDDRNQLDYYLIYYFTDDIHPELQPDEVALIQIPSDSVTQKGHLMLPDSLILDGETTYPNIMWLIAVCSSESGDGPSCLIFGDDATPPENLYLTVTQNPVDDHYIDIYSFCDERILPDGGQLYRVESIGLTELEGPTVEISGGVWESTGDDTVFVLDQDVFYSNPQASAYSYNIAYQLDGIEFPADLTFSAFGEDISGNEKSSDGLLVTVDFIDDLAGGVIEQESSAASVYIPPKALKNDAYIMLSVSDVPVEVVSMGTSREISGSTDPVHSSVGPMVSVGSASIDLLAPIELEIPFNRNIGGTEEVGVYRAEGDGWVYIGGVVDPNQDVLNTYSWKFGQFRAFAGPVGDFKPEMPFSFKLDQNYPNPFNPSTTISFELSQAQHVAIEVFNLAGQRISRIADRSYDAGRHEIHWQPDRLASGVYFLRLHAEEGTLYRKMMLLK
jgi:hypothetical protein